MASDIGKAALALGVLSLAAALFVPSLIGATQDNATQTFNFSEGDDTELTDKLLVELDTANGSQYNATVVYQDLSTLKTNTTAMNDSEYASANLSGDTLKTGLQSFTNTTATFNVSYPPMFGWNSGARTFMQQMDTILALLGGAMILIGAGVSFDL